jgi:glucose-1-phosphate adenylyltransferase
MSNTVMMGADYESLFQAHGPESTRGLPPIGIGRGCTIDGAIIDKNARIGDGVRLVNEQNVEQADGDNYYIRGGIIVVPKGGVIRPGIVV